MKPFRHIALSVHKVIEDQFKSGELVGVSYNVYREGDMRSGAQPQFPFVYILDFGATFEVEHLPVVIVQLTMKTSAFEMGNTNIFCDLNLHVFARDGGQKYDLAGALSEIESFQMYDFSDPNNPEELDSSDLEEDESGTIWTVSDHQLDDNRLAIEGTLRAWKTLSASFYVNSFQ